MPQITVQNREQAALLNLELMGQLSDGYWENSKPSDHWRTPCSAKVVIGEELSVDFYPSRKYNFANKMLLDCVGDRMMTYCRVVRKFPTLSMDAIDIFNCGEWWWKQKVTDNKKYAKIVNKILAELKAVGINSYDEMKAVVDNLDDSVYTMKELRKDLKAINTAFKTIK